MFRRVVTVVLCGFALGGSPLAHAQSETEPNVEEARNLERAVMLFEESEQLYNAGEFAQAAVMLRRAYALHPDATLLFNLARALEGMGDLDGAIETYGRYLAEAEGIRDRGAVEARLETLRAQREALAQRPADPVQEIEPDPEEPEPERGGSSPLPWIVAGTGVAAAVAGVVLGLRSQSLSDDAAAEPVMTEAVELHDRAQRFATVGNILMIAGGVIAAGGLLWGVLTLGSDDSETEAAIVPGGVLVRGRF